MSWLAPLSTGRGHSVGDGLEAARGQVQYYTVARVRLKEHKRLCRPNGTASSPITKEREISRSVAKASVVRRSAPQVDFAKRESKLRCNYGGQSWPLCCSLRPACPRTRRALQLCATRRVLWHSTGFGREMAGCAAFEHTDKVSVNFHATVHFPSHTLCPGPSTIVVLSVSLCPLFCP